LEIFNRLVTFNFPACRPVGRKAAAGRSHGPVELTFIKAEQNAGGASDKAFCQRTPPRFSERNPRPSGLVGRRASLAVHNLHSWLGGEERASSRIRIKTFVPAGFHDCLQQPSPRFRRFRHWWRLRLRPSSGASQNVAALELRPFVTLSPTTGEARFRGGAFLGVGNQVSGGRPRKRRGSCNPHPLFNAGHGPAILPSVVKTLELRKYRNTVLDVPRC